MAKHGRGHHVLLTYSPSMLYGHAGNTDGIIGVSCPYNLQIVQSGENIQPGADGMCELCGRLVREDRLTRHHLLPRSRARKMKRRRKGRQELRWRDPARTVALCAPCHRNVHLSIGNADLERGYDSVEALRDHPGVRKFTDWVKDKPHGRA